jgi:predicted nucleic acid binding AN1-type Zn finger protein
MFSFVWAILNIGFVITFNASPEQSYFCPAATRPAAHFCLCGPSKFEKHPLQPLTLIRTDLL